MSHRALPVLTASRLTADRACHRYHFNRYELGYRSIFKDAAPRFGLLFHDGQEAWWKNADAPADDRLGLMLAACEKAEDPFERVKAEELLRGYHYRWIDEPYRVIAVEREFRGPLVHPITGEISTEWELGGKLDVLAVDLRDELARLVEHKTSAEDITSGSEYWRRLRMNGQVSVYYEGAEILGYEVAGCIFDVAGKPTLRPSDSVPKLDDDGLKIVLDASGARVRTKDGKKWRQTADSEAGYVLQTRAETPDEFRRRLVEAIAAEPARYYQRGEVVRLERERAESMVDVWQQGELIAENRARGRHPRNPDSCTRYGRTCEFFAVCTGEASLDDTTLFSRSTRVHPELAGDEPEAGSKEESATP